MRQVPDSVAVETYKLAQDAWWEYADLYIEKHNWKSSALEEKYLQLQVEVCQLAHRRAYSDGYEKLEKLFHKITEILKNEFNMETSESFPPRNTPIYNRIKIA